MFLFFVFVFLIKQIKQYSFAIKLNSSEINKNSQTWQSMSYSFYLIRKFLFFIV